MPTIVGILTFMSRKKFMLSWVEHEKSFITSGPGLAHQKRHSIQVDSSIIICWTSHYVILGVSGLLCRFYSIFDGNASSKQYRHWSDATYVASDLGCIFCVWLFYGFLGKNGLKGYCTVSLPFPYISLINRYLLYKHNAENPIKNSVPNSNYWHLKFMQFKF